MRNAFLKSIAPLVSRAARPVGCGLGLFLLFALLYQGFWSLQRSAPGRKIAPGKAVVLSSPRWWQKWTGNLPIEINLRPGATVSWMEQPGFPRLVATELSRHPLVEQVVEVRRIYPMKLRVAVRLRRPAAGVAVTAGGITRYYLADRHGVRLSDALPGWPGIFPVPLITATGGDFPARGQSWKSPVSWGLRVLAVLQQGEWIKKLRVVRIDVSAVGAGTGPVSLWTETGAQIVWGRPPGSPSADLDLEHKIKNLQLLLTAYPRLEGLETVRIHFEQPVLTERRL